MERGGFGPCEAKMAIVALSAANLTSRTRCRLRRRRQGALLRNSCRSSCLRSAEAIRRSLILVREQAQELAAGNARSAEQNDWADEHLPCLQFSP